MRPVRPPNKKAVLVSDERTERNFANPGAWSSDEWADWPEARFEIDDEAFAAAIAKGRELDEAA